MVTVVHSYGYNFLYFLYNIQYLVHFTIFYLNTNKDNAILMQIRYVVIGIPTRAKGICTRRNIA